MEGVHVRAYREGVHIGRVCLYGGIFLTGYYVTKFVG